ncbi:MAG: formylglycine-generating enzyme family protein [Cellvibrionaceae bacterium]
MLDKKQCKQLHSDLIDLYNRRAITEKELRDYLIPSNFDKVENTKLKYVGQGYSKYSKEYKYIASLDVKKIMHFQDECDDLQKRLRLSTSKVNELLKLMAGGEVQYFDQLRESNFDMELCRFLYYEPLFHTANRLQSKMSAYEHVNADMVNREIYHCRDIMNFNVAEYYSQSLCSDKFEEDFPKNSRMYWRLKTIDNQYYYREAYDLLFEKQTPAAYQCHRREMWEKHQELYTCAYGILLLKYTDFAKTTNKTCKDFSEIAKKDYGMNVDFCKQLESTDTSDPMATTSPQWEKQVSENKNALARELAGEFVSIPGGSFMMGSNDDDGKSYEEPVHRVHISPFKMGKFEVTWTQYQPCIDEGICPKINYYLGGSAGFGKGNRPMINVSWNDITQYYTPWLNRKTGKRFRPPTEAEWEYAARAGSTSKYSWGNSIDCSKARYGYYSDDCGKQKSTDPVGSFAPNAFGLYDMHGNVWEWVQDCSNDNYYGAPSNGSAWESGDCTERIMRGGSWNSTPYGLRSSLRNWADAGSRRNIAGFRLVQDN